MEQTPTQRFKLNIDASVVCGLATGGGVLRDHEGKMIFAFYQEFGERQNFNSGGSFSFTWPGYMFPEKISEHNG